MSRSTFWLWCAAAWTVQLRACACIEVLLCAHTYLWLFSAHFLLTAHHLPHAERHECAPPPQRRPRSRGAYSKPHFSPEGDEAACQRAPKHPLRRAAQFEPSPKPARKRDRRERPEALARERPHRRSKVRAATLWNRLPLSEAHRVEDGRNEGTWRETEQSELALRRVLAQAYQSHGWRAPRAA